MRLNSTHCDLGDAFADPSLVLIYSGWSKIVDIAIGRYMVLVIWAGLSVWLSLFQFIIFCTAGDSSFRSLCRFYQAYGRRLFRHGGLSTARRLLRDCKEWCVVGNLLISAFLVWALCPPWCWLPG